MTTVHLFITIALGLLVAGLGLVVAGISAVVPHRYFVQGMGALTILAGVVVMIALAVR